MIAQGKPVAEKLKEYLAHELVGNKKSVCFVVFGEDPVTEQFVSMKMRFAEKVGVHAVISKHTMESTFDQIKKIIEEEIAKKYNGIVVQLPLPKNVDTQKVLNLIPPSLDVDVLSDDAKKMFDQGVLNKIPPVARAVNEILKYYGVKCIDKKILVVGSGRLVGEPVALMFHQKGVKFDQIDKDTPEIKKIELLKSADVIISGAGDPFFIKPEMIKEGAVIIDAGTSESEGKIVGDVDPACYEKVSLVTPVPGGIGPVTLASLFLNL